ncbi:hypothetical protein Tco_1013304 [Tanacetum coccineum]
MVNYTMHVVYQSLGKMILDIILSWKQERVRLLAGSPGASTNPSYSPGPSTHPSYSQGLSRNVECSNYKFLIGKIKKRIIAADGSLQQINMTSEQSDYLWYSISHLDSALAESKELLRINILLQHIRKMGTQESEMMVAAGDSRSIEL